MTGKELKALRESLTYKLGNGPRRTYSLDRFCEKMKVLHPTLNPAPYRKSFLTFCEAADKPIPKDWELTATEVAEDIRLGLAGHKELFRFRRSLRNTDDTYCTLKVFAKLLLGINKEINPYPSAALVSKVEAELEPMPKSWRALFPQISELWAKKIEEIREEMSATASLTPPTQPAATEVSEKVVDEQSDNNLTKFYTVVAFETMNTKLGVTTVIEILKLLGPDFDINLHVMQEIRKSLIEKALMKEKDLIDLLSQL